MWLGVGSCDGGITCNREGMSFGWRENLLKTMAKIKSHGVKYDNFWETHVQSPKVFLKTRSPPFEQRRQLTFEMINGIKYKLWCATRIRFRIGSHHSQSNELENLFLMIIMSTCADVLFLEENLIYWNWNSQNSYVKELLYQMILYIMKGVSCKLGHFKVMHVLEAFV